MYNVIQNIILPVFVCELEVRLSH